MLSGPVCSMSGRVTKRTAWSATQIHSPASTGRRSGTNTRRSVRPKDAPLMYAASSSSAWICSSAVDAVRVP